MEVGQLLEGIFADDVGVEDEERFVVLAQDLLGELEGTGCSQGFGFDGECNLDIVLLFIFLQGTRHDFGPVVDCKDNVCDTGCCESFDLMQNHRTVAELDERFWESEGERSQSGAEATNAGDVSGSVAEQCNMVEAYRMRAGQR